MLPVRTILHPTDFSESSKAALRLAYAVARDYGARLVLLHVTPSIVVSVAFVTIPPEPADMRDKLLEELAQLPCPDPKLNVERLLREGDPVTEILNLAREIQCDLIVMGTQGRSGLGRVLLGSVAEGVLRKSPCAVLTVKSPVADPSSASN